MTRGADRLTGGRLLKRHLSQEPITRRETVTTPLWPAAFDGLRIGHVTDFHFGELMPAAVAAQVVGRLKGETPDLLACTGDVIDLDASGVEPILAAMADVQAPMGCFLVLGNHDLLDDPEYLIDAAQDHGITVLENQRLSVGHGQEHLHVAGTMWARTPAENARCVDEVCGQGHVDLLLAHNPKAFDAAAAHDVAMTLAGHTHGGQIAVRNRPEANMAVAHRRSAGLYEHGDSRMFVSVGVGSWFPLRINCPAELAVLTMHHSPESPTPTG